MMTEIMRALRPRKREDYRAQTERLRRANEEKDIEIKRLRSKLLAVQEFVRSALS